MKLLAVSTSAKLPSAALFCGEDIKLLEDASSAPHSVSLMPLVDRLLSENGLSASDIDLFAADIGPGSFTGVRIGVSAVNAMAFALQKPIVPVSSLAALRHAAKDPLGRVCAMLDCRNGNGYAAVFEGGECIMEPCACVKSELLGRLGEYELVGESGQTDARLVLLEALEMLKKDPSCAVSSAVPLYLRPSQAERMKGADAAQPDTASPRSP